MTSAAADYFTDLTSRLDRLSTDQAKPIDAAAELFAAAIAGCGRVHVHDTGHMIGHEFVSRTGGFLAFTRLEYGGSVSTDGLARASDPDTAQADQATAARLLLEWVFAQNTIRAGDVLLLSSVSGVSIAVVELALQARSHGIPVVALTSSAFSLSLTSRHPSGQRLMDVADVVLDNLAPYGDAVQPLPGLLEPVCPISGVAGAALLWSVVALTADKLLAQGVVPSIYPSINLPDGPERVAAIEQHYKETGQ
jgi:uncharacterized phosphosugar-binding protein